MVGINKAPIMFDLETVFTKIQAGIAPKAFGRGEMIALIVQNPLLNPDGTTNNSTLFVGSASNMIYFMLPGQESPIIYAEDLKDVYLRLNFPAVNPNGAILTFAVANNSTGTGYSPGDVLSLPGGTSIATVTVATTNTGITAATLNAGGAGYSPGDNVTVNGGSTLAHLIIDTVDGGGAVLTFHIVTTGGNGYAVAAAVATTGGGGAGFKVNITTVRGSVVTAALTTAGLGYEAEEIITTTGGGGTGAVMVVLTVETVTDESADITAIIYRQRKGGRQ